MNEAVIDCRFVPRRSVCAGCFFMHYLGRHLMLCRGRNIPAATWLLCTVLQLGFDVQHLKYFASHQVNK